MPARQLLTPAPVRLSQRRAAGLLATLGIVTLGAAGAGAGRRVTRPPPLERGATAGAKRAQTQAARGALRAFLRSDPQPGLSAARRAIASRSAW